MDTTTISNTGEFTDRIPFPSERLGNGSSRKAHVELPLNNAAASTPAAKSHPKEGGYRIATVLFLGDWVMSCVAVAAGLGLRTLQRGDWPAYWTSLHQWTSPATLWVLVGGSMFPWLLMAFKTYEVTNVYRMHFWAKNILKVGVIWPMMLLAAMGLTHEYAMAPRLGVIYCGVTLVSFLVVWRLFAYLLLVQPQVRQHASCRTLVVGWNDKATQLRGAMRTDFAQLGEVIGCVPAPGGRFSVKPPREVPVLGDYSDLPTLVGECQLHSIILADVSCPAREIQRLIAFCNRELMGFQLVPEYFPALGSGLEIKTLHGVPLLGISKLPLDRTANRVMKRIIDIAGGLFGMIVSFPIIAVFCTLVYLESPGPILFRQKRTSRFGRDFHIYKIRSMRVDAEASSGAVWAKRDDPRRLKVGTFMRKWNIDELPQFWNVLKGDMSLVGPRPERPELIERFKDEIPNYNVRHEVKSGLTGWAQIHGLRGDTDLGKRIEMDIHYLENWSPLLDMYCLVATLFNNKNAH